MTDGGSSMGDLFNQRRAARKNQPSEQRPTKLGPTGGSSLLDIQAEQERERQPYGGSRSSNTNNMSRGDFGGGNRDGGSSRRDYGGGNRDGGGSRGDYGGNRGGDYSGSRGSRGDYGRDRRRRGPDRSSMPVEQGLIASLKDSFGFIYCADRPEEIFFHYSELQQGCRSSDLEKDMEVEFRVGPSSRDHDKMAAYQLRLLEPNTIVWETQDEPDKKYKGMVERPIRSERGGGSSQEGTIRMLLESDKDEDGVVSATEGPLVRFTANDYTPLAAQDRSFRRTDSAASSSSRGGSGRLCRGDLVEFLLVTERRTKTKAARSIEMIQSERERQRIKKEKELLANATLEQGVVTTLKSEFGFLKSNRRREEVHFHYSNVEVPDDGELVLKEGQDMEFLVVTESSGGASGRKKLSARQIKFKPRGSVVFHTQVAEGVTGVITRCPHPVDSSYADEMMGRVRLTTPINCEDGTVVSEVVLKSGDAPGGSYAANRDGSSVGLWVREGDTLLFDVVKELVDDAYCACPTKHTRPVVGGTENQTEETESGAKKAVRMVSLSLAGRTEGVVHAIKDNYGFISCVERPVDTYFRFYEVLPENMQADLRQNMHAADAEKPISLAVGAEVQFDLSLQGRVMSPSARSKRSGVLVEKDNLKAQRILFLPPSTIVQTKILAKDMKGVVTKEDPKQPYAGLIELEEEVKSMTLEELHPLAAKLVDSMLADHAAESVVYPDLQSLKEDQLMMKMVEARGRGELVCSHIPAAGGDNDHPGRLCITRVKNQDTEPKSDQNDDSENSRAATSRKDSTEEGSSSEVGSEVANSSGHGESPSKHSKRKPKSHKAKPVKLVRFDKHCLTKELQNGMPLGKDDVVMCDLIQIRRTGMVSLTNIRVVERSQIERGVSLEGNESAEKSSGVGIVSEVVASRQFGFISVLDENASKREMLFFHTSNVVVDDGNGNAATPSKPRKLDGTVGKGDEVKFDIGTGKNGKRIATNIHVVPRGTLDIPSTAEKNACRGLVLMEPSHSSLANTPLRQSAHGPGAPGKAPGVGGGRWDKVKGEDLTRTPSGSNVKEQGSILLLSDPANLFGRKGSTRIEKKENKDSPSDSGHGGEVADTAETPEAEAKVGVVAEESFASCLCTHLPYKNGGLALHGPGASSSADRSSGPRRGDLVSFMKSKGGKGVRDVRVVTRGAAIMVRGRLENIIVSASFGGEELVSPGTAKFIAATSGEEEYDIDLSEVVSCDPSRLKDRESVEGILHEGKIYGVCRTTDLYLETKLGASHKERPRLNLTVRKELKGRGAKIMAQSMMAKGPDGTNGFVTGWTKRVSEYVVVPESEDEIAQAVDTPDETALADVDSTLEAV